MTRMVGILSLFLALVCSQGAMAQTPNGVSQREAEGLAKFSRVVNGADEKEALSILRELSAFPYPSVARKLLQYVAIHLADANLVQEAEWTLVSMGAKVIDPLVAEVEERPELHPSALVILSRIARRDPDAVALLLKHQDPDVRRLALVSLWGTGAMEARSRVLATFESMDGTLQSIAVDVVCARASKACKRLIDAALNSDSVPVLRHALGAVARRRITSARPRIAALLHHRNPQIANASLQTLEVLGGEGVERELAVYFESAQESAQVAVLRILAQVYSMENLRLLADVDRRFSRRSPVGREAHRIRREGVGRMVLARDSTPNAPEEAVLVSNQNGRCRLLLFTEMGYRVVQEGVLLFQGGRSGKRQKEFTEKDFSQDGSIPLSFRCDGDDPLPVMRWKRKGGGTIQVQVEER